MKVFHRRECAEYTVYDIQYSKSGSILFLVYMDEKWQLVNAIDFTPDLHETFYGNYKIE